KEWIQSILAAFWRWLRHAFQTSFPRTPARHLSAPKHRQTQKSPAVSQASRSPRCRRLFVVVMTVVAPVMANTCSIRGNHGTGYNSKSDQGKQNVTKHLHGATSETSRRPSSLPGGPVQRSLTLQTRSAEESCHRTQPCYSLSRLEATSPLAAGSSIRRCHRCGSPSPRLP